MQLRPDLAHATTHLGMGKDVVTGTLFTRGCPPSLQPSNSAYSSPQECCGGRRDCWTAADCSHHACTAPAQVESTLAGRVTCGGHFLCAPAQYVVIGVAQLVEKGSEEFPQVGVVWLASNRSEQQKLRYVANSPNNDRQENRNGGDEQNYRRRELAVNLQYILYYGHMCTYIRMYVCSTHKQSCILLHR